MTSSIIDIWNLALSKARARSKVSSTTENSRERDLCSRWYDIVLDTVQEASYWPSSKVRARLALLQERDFTKDWVQGDPSPGYCFSYALPENYLRAWYLDDYQPFEIEFDSVRNRRVLYTNTENAILVYAYRNELVPTWTPGQKIATAHGLAASISPELSGKTSVIRENVEAANDLILQARSDAANAPAFRIDTTPPWIQARGYAENQTLTRYFYPLGSLFSASQADVR